MYIYDSLLLIAEFLNMGRSRSLLMHIHGSVAHNGMMNVYSKTLISRCKQNQESRALGGKHAISFIEILTATKKSSAIVPMDAFNTVLKHTTYCPSLSFSFSFISLRRFTATSDPCASNFLNG